MSEVLKLQNVCKSFGKRMVVQDISFTVEAGQIFGFLGPNGAGKTTHYQNDPRPAHPGQRFHSGDGP